MRLLHTADWHLGQRLCDRDRREEHDFFLAWLLEILHTHKVDTLIVAGDVFDAGSPPSYALRQYYDFLVRCAQICPNIVIIGGNHDSMATLNAPRQLLESLNVYVIGGACANIADEIIELHSKSGELIGVVGAVPFLRERDIRRATAGESYTQKVQQIRAGIKQHYATIANLLLPYQQRGIPSLVTGHLVVTGSNTKKEDISDVERDIYIGNQGNVSTEVFPKTIDYVALGHIHKPKVINTGKAHIRYSGSPIPLSFSERTEQKQVLLVDLVPDQKAQIQSIAVPTYRKLIRFKGNISSIIKQLKNFDDKQELATPWIEVHIDLEKYQPNLDATIRSVVADKEVDILAVRAKYKKQPKSLEEQLSKLVSLDDLQPLEVFLQKCESVEINPTDQITLQQTFQELLEWMTTDEVSAVTGYRAIEK